MNGILARIRVCVVMSLLATHAQELRAQDAPPPQATFAREFVRVLRDSGSVGVIPLTVSKTRALKGYAPNMDVLRKELSPKEATISLLRWSTVPPKGDVPALVLVVFKVDGIARPVELSLYIEDVNGQYLLNTIMTKEASPSQSLLPSPALFVILNTTNGAEKMWDEMS